MSAKRATSIFDPAQISSDLANPSLISFVDMARWMAAAMVMVGHIRNPMFLGFGALTPAEKPIWVKAWFFITGYHAEAVLVFFVLSGFLVGGLSMARAQTGRFALGSYAIDRIARLFIAFIPALLLTLLLDWCGSTYFGGTGLYNGTHPMIVQKIHGDIFQNNLSPTILIGNLMMLQYYFVPELGSNSPLWTLSTEFWFYAIFGILLAGLLLKDRIRWIYVAAGLAATTILGGEFLIYFGLWLIGFGAACLHIRRTGSPLVALALLTAWLLYMRFYDPMFDANNGLKHAAHYVMALLFGWLILAMRGCSVKWVERLGGFNKFMADFSYSVYLIHFPLMIFAVAVLGKITGNSGFSTGFVPTNSVGIFAYIGVIALCLGCAWVFAQFTERNTPRLRNWLKAKFL